MTAPAREAAAAVGEGSDLRAQNSQPAQAAARGGGSSRWSGARFTPSATPVVLAFAVVAATVLVGASVTYRETRKGLQREKLAELLAIADLKAEQILRFRWERLAEGQSIGQASYFGRAFARWAARGAPEDAERSRLVARVRSIREGFGYRKVWLTDASGTVRLIVGEEEELSSAARTAIEEARRDLMPRLTDLYRGDGESEISMDLVVPLVDVTDGSTAIGFYVCEWDPGTYLFPLIQRWPGTSRTAETLLVRRADGDILFLNELRHRKGTALVLKVPARADLPAARALLERAAGEAVDYRGVPVLGAWRPLPGTGWGIVAKEDAAEVFAPVSFWGGVMAGTITLLLAISSVAVGLWVRQQRLWRKLSERTAELERAAHERRFRELFEGMLEGFALHEVVLDAQGEPIDTLLLEANPAWERATGLSAAEVVGKRTTEAQPGIQKEWIKKLGRVAVTGEPIRFEETVAVPGKTFDCRAFSPSPGRVAVIFSDVTDKRRTERALEESEERLRQFAEYTDDVVWINGVAPERRIYLSPSAERVWGVPAETFLAEPRGWMEFVAPEHRQRVCEAYDAVVEGRAARYETEYRISRPGGATKWILDSGKPVRDAGGRLLTVVGIAKDITTRKLAEEKAALMSRLYEALSATNKAIVHSATPGELFHQVCDAAVLKGGFPVAWIVEVEQPGNRIRYAAVAGRSREMTEEVPLSLDPAALHSKGPMAEALLTGETVIENDLVGRFESRPELSSLAATPNRYGVASVAAVPLRRGGSVAACLTVFSAEKGYFDAQLITLLEEMGRDISFALDSFDREEGRRTAEAALRESEERWRTIVQNEPECVKVLDREGRLLEMNPAGLSMIQATSEQVLGSRAVGLVAEEDRPRFDEMVAAVFRGEARHLVFDMIGLEGRRLTLETTSVPLWDITETPPVVKAFLGVTRDITERKRAEVVREVAYRISEAAGGVGTLDEFFAHVHEIVGTVIPANNFYVALLDKEKGTLSFPYFVDEADTRPAPKPLGHGLTELVIRTGEPLLASPEVFDELLARGEVEFLGAPSIDWLGAPLKVSGETIGAVVVQSYATGLRYGASDKDFLSFISGQLAMSIERKRAEIAVRDAERRFQLLAEATSEGIAISEKGTIIDCNPQFATLLGISIQETVGRSLLEFVAPEFVGVLRERIQAGQVERIEAMALRRDGSRFPVEAEARIVASEGRTVRIAVFRDLTDQRRSEAEIARVHRLHMALIGINEAIVRIQTQAELFREVPRVLVESGGFKMVWMGWCDSASPLVPVVGSHGDDSGYLNSTQIYTDQRPEGLGVTGTAIREGRSVVCNDFMNDPRTFPFRKAASRAGWQASAAFPVRLAGEVHGALTVYAPEMNFFGDREVTLLEQAATDISYALDNLDRDARRSAAEQALRASGELLRQSQSIARLGSYVLDVPTGHWSSSEILDEIFGIGPDFKKDIDGWSALVHPEFRDEMVRYFTEEVLAGGRRFEREYKIVRGAGGEERWVLGIGELERDGEGRIIRMVGTIQDVTERRRSEERFRLWSHVLENSAEGIFVVDGKGTIITVNRAFTELTGYPDPEVIGRSPEFLESGQHGPEFYRSIRGTIREIGRWQGEVSSRRKNGEVFPVWLSITTILGAGDKPSHFIGVFSDITERKQSADRIQYLATHDFLTGLPNRSLVDDLLREAVARALRKGESVGVLFLDLDRFKTINDSLGHLAGDILLQRVAERLGGCLRAGDTVSRLGGDEFLILLPEIGRAQDAAAVAVKILKAMQGPFSLPDREVGISASIGIAVHPSDGQDTVTLVKNADAAMYHAKERGRNNYQFFTPDMNTRAFEALAMESSLRRALDRAEFFLVYQPQVETATGRITGMEALVRWTHPDLGMVLPGRFIPVAEERGLIVPIGDWVLRTACQQVRAWLDAGLPAVPVAVNVSALQFESGHFADSVGAILSETGLSAGYLELELTESIVMREAEEMMAILVALREMGVRLAIDDFGTGFSSLSYLARLPIGKLKIDQSFVRDAGASPSARAIISAIVSMARSLGLRVIAEGVETDEQLRILRSEGCEEVQGYLLSAPIGASEFTSLLKTQRSLPAGGQRPN